MELDQTTMGIIGILAGILILSGWIPQIIKGHKTKKLDDVSSYLMILIFAGAALWLVYGLALDDVYIICLLYTSPSPRDGLLSRMPSSA